MNILQNNPYRLLGVYSNSPTRERLANHNRMKAFLKVGRSVSFPLDLPQYLAPINRTESSVADAEAKLTLPKEQILYAQFWFVKMTPLDDVAFNHLIAGEIDKAEEIWKKRECASSLQNRLVCALMRGKYDNAITCAEELYSKEQYASQLVTAIIGSGGYFDAADLALSFLDTLCEEVGANKLLPFITNGAWKNHAEEKAVKPLIDGIQESINIAQRSKEQGPNARLNAGETLRNDTKKDLLQLKKFLSATDLQYQMIADKLAQEILQCSIDYYNGTDDDDAPEKTMTLQKYALSIAVGALVKKNCKENVNTLQKIIKDLPPIAIREEYNTLTDLLDIFQYRQNKITTIKELLDKAKPHLQIIRNRQGGKNCYLRISTHVVSMALSKLIEIINNSKDEADVKYAWKIMLILDTFDMDYIFKSTIYNKNREILHERYIKISSYWQAALTLHLVCIVIGIFVALNEYDGFDENILYWSIAIGSISWIYPRLEKIDNRIDLATFILSRVGCLGAFFSVPLVPGFFIFKIIRFIIISVRL